MPSRKGEGAGAAAGPLVISKANPRYFAVRSKDGGEGRLVYLTGSHIWNNFHDGMGPGAEGPETPERLDYGAYLRFLKERGHNFIRLWRWENFKSQAAGGSYHLCMTPQPWPRSGPGVASDGKPKFDLSKLDEAYFARLRERVIAAGDDGIYVGVMLFEGWALHLSPAPDNVLGHPFHAENNVNGIGIESIVDYQVVPLDPKVRAVQEAYVRRVVDTLHDLPNVLYEVANESSGQDAELVELPGGMVLPGPVGDSTAWQYWVIDLVKRYEVERGYDSHPMGMTMQFPVAVQSKANDVLFDSTAEWISPGFDEELKMAEGGHGPEPSRWYKDPPANDGRKVVIADTDHFAPGQGEAVWAWKAFLRGQHPILMDFGLIEGVEPPNPSDPAAADSSFAAFEPGRYAMGDTRRYAERIGLAEMEPRGDLCSTGYALANPGKEYLALQPGKGPIRVTLEAGTYGVEWFDVDERKTTEPARLTVQADGSESFTAPFASGGPSVLYLWKEASRVTIRP